MIPGANWIFLERLILQPSAELWPIGFVAKDFFLWESAIPGATVSSDHLLFRKP
jgi:hypothetical protein